MVWPTFWRSRFFFTNLPNCLVALMKIKRDRAKHLWKGIIGCYSHEYCIYAKTSNLSRVISYFGVLFFVAITSAVVEDRFLCRHVGSISSRRRQLSTKQWSGNKCSDVPTKIQTSSYAMDHRDWPGNSGGLSVKHAAALTWQHAFRKQSSLFEGLFYLAFVF